MLELLWWFEFELTDHGIVGRIGVERPNSCNSPQGGIYQCQDVETVSEVDKPTLQDIIKDKVSIETTSYSDTWKFYNGLEEDFADHQTVNNSEAEY